MNGQACGSKTSPPAKRTLELDPDENGELDASAPKKARLASSQEGKSPGGEEEALFEKEPEAPLRHPRPRRLPSPLAGLLGEPSPHPVDPLEVFVSSWLQSVGSSEQSRRRDCRSDSALDQLRDKDGHQQISRQQTLSAPPDMGRKDADGFTIPRTPVSGSASVNSNNRGRPRPGSIPASDAGTSNVSRSSSADSRITVSDDNYLDTLKNNNIHLVDYQTPLPDHVQTLVGQMRRRRDSPDPTPAELEEDASLGGIIRGSSEEAVVDYFKQFIVPQPRTRTTLARVSNAQMIRQVVPFSKAPGVPRFSTPTPDLLFGLNRDEAFPDQGHLAYISDHDSEVRPTKANPEFLVYPFFVIEFKGREGTMWVATNQCLGGAATCVSIAEGLNRQLQAYAQVPAQVQTQNNEKDRSTAKGKGKDKSVRGNGGDGGDGEQIIHAFDSTAFSIAMNGTTAHLYVSWKHDDLNYYTRAVDGFVLFKPEHFIEFRRMVRNIVDWGKNERLAAIQRSLDTILEEARKQTAREAKARERSPETAGSTPSKGGSSSSYGGKGKKAKT